jgi:hypothetical protein
LSEYDNIGDVHGEGDKLQGLLTMLGYRESNGAYHRVDRTAIFVGDLIDRGPDQIRVVKLVRAMVDAGSARVVLGNHEFNAIAFATPDGHGDYLRTHKGKEGEKNLDQHQKFLDQVTFGSPLHEELLSWFKSLPLWLETRTFRVVHACWHDDLIESLRRRGFEGGLTTDNLIRTANEKDSEEYRSIETILKGPELSLKGYPAFKDKDKNIRHHARLRWWDCEAKTLAELAEIPGDALDENDDPYPGLPNVPVTDAHDFLYDPLAPPIFFGHYWRLGPPELAGTNTVCVDYSAAHPHESLVAYRHDEGAALDVGRFARYPA